MYFIYSIRLILLNFLHTNYSIFFIKTIAHNSGTNPKIYSFKTYSKIVKMTLLINRNSYFLLELKDI